MVWIVILIVLVGADQLLKYLVMSSLTGNQSITVLDGFFYIIHRRNPGAAWSFLANAEWGSLVLAILSTIASIVLLILLFRMPKVQYKVCLTLMASGAIGNLIDRIRLKSVTDFLDFHFGSYVFPTFNLADICLVVGTILFCLVILTDPQSTESVDRKQTYLS